MRIHRLLALSAVLSSACGGKSDVVQTSGDAAVPDLPSGWSAATRVESLTQAACSGSPYVGSNERAAFLPGRGRFEVDYRDAHFRCNQKVEGFFKTTGGAIDVLVQPVDMSPDSVTRCDCLYDITVIVGPIPAGGHDVTLSRRWDDLNDPNDPVQIGSGFVTVQ
jgi:hypothetical protein